MQLIFFNFHNIENIPNNIFSHRLHQKFEKNLNIFTHVSSSMHTAYALCMCLAWADAFILLTAHTAHIHSQVMSVIRAYRHHRATHPQLGPKMSLYAVCMGAEALQLTATTTHTHTPWAMLNVDDVTFLDIISHKHITRSLRSHSGTPKHSKISDKKPHVRTHTKHSAVWFTARAITIYSGRCAVHCIRATIR